MACEPEFNMMPLNIPEHGPAGQRAWTCQVLIVDYRGRGKRYHVRRNHSRLPLLYVLMYSDPAPLAYVNQQKACITSKCHHVVMTAIIPVNRMAKELEGN
jgi:hypothetical protein